jgi:hypothetical protein
LRTLPTNILISVISKILSKVIYYFDFFSRRRFLASAAAQRSLANDISLRLAPAALHFEL